MRFPIGPLYVGTSQTLNCTATLPASVDTDITVSVQWTGPNISSSDRITVSHPSNTESPFISTLTLSPLTRDDAGNYDCQVTATSSSPYITESSPGESEPQSLTVTGVCVCVFARRFTKDNCSPLSVLPAPNVTISFSGSSTAGENYSIKCSANVVPGLVIEPLMEIDFSNSTLAAGNSLVEHTFSLLKTSDGGEYTCTATINIPQAYITNLNQSATGNITVASGCVSVWCYSLNSVFSPSAQYLSQPSDSLVE